MLRQIGVAVLLLAGAGASRAAIWPEYFNGLTRDSATAVTLPDPALAEEYGFEAGEKAVYGEGKFTATAWRAKDSTGAYAIRLWLEGEKPVHQGLIQLGNYILEFKGPKPGVEEFKKLYVVLPRIEQSPLPTLVDFLPKDPVPGSARYVLGPTALARFVPGIPPSVAGFHFGTEGEVLTSKTQAGDLRLAVFSFPSHQIARAQLAEFQKLPGMVVKRDGPLVAVAVNPPNPDVAEVVLAKVRYRAQITWNERTPSQQAQSVGSLLLSIFSLAGICIGFCVAAGVLFAGIRLLRRKLAGNREEPGEMIVLHIDDSRR